MYDDMNYVDRAVVERLGMNTDIAVIPAEDITLWDNRNDNEIGKGAFGKVFLKRYQDQAVAVKVPYTKGETTDTDDEQMNARIKSNYARTTMEALVHIVLAQDSAFPKFRGIVHLEGVPSLVLEFLGDKKTGEVFSLSQAIKFQIPEISRENWLEIVSDIILGVKAMHEHGLLHNDLKANNVLLQFDKEADRWRAYIIDMGKVSTFTMPIKHSKIPREELEGYKDGTLYQHLAPEYIIDLEPTSVYTDIYSLGRLIGYIAVLIKSQALRELSTSMTHTKPRFRPTWKKIESSLSKARQEK